MARGLSTRQQGAFLALARARRTKGRVAGASSTKTWPAACQCVNRAPSLLLLGHDEPRGEWPGHLAWPSIRQIFFPLATSRDKCHPLNPARGRLPLSVFHVTTARLFPRHTRPAMGPSLPSARARRGKGRGSLALLAASGGWLVVVAATDDLLHRRSDEDRLRRVSISSLLQRPAHGAASRAARLTCSN